MLSTYYDLHRCAATGIMMIIIIIIKIIKIRRRRRRRKKNIYHLLYIPQTLNNSLSSYKNYSQSGDSRSNCDIDST